MADFFDKMKTSINKGVATVSAGSKTMLEKTKQNGLIKSLEDEKSELCRMLGNKVFTICTQNSDGDIPREEVQSFCDEIIKRNVQIVECRKRIQELDAEMDQVRGAAYAQGGRGAVCSCGCVNAAEAKFCRQCGKPLA